MTRALHERIRSDYEARILSGALAPGERLPTEQALMRHYGCSRMTVSKALSALATAGLIERRKRAGTFVARPRLHSMILDVPDIAVQVADRGQTYRFALIAKTVRLPEAGVDDEVQLAGGERLMQIDGLHLADGKPIAIEYRLVSLRAVPAIAGLDLSVHAPGGWLLQHVPWTEAETRISAVAVQGAEARLLGVAAGTPCLCVERGTWRGAERITQVRQLFLADSYDMVARFGPAVATGTPG